MAGNKKYAYLMLHKVGGDLVRKVFEKRRKNIGSLSSLNQFSQLPRKQKKKLANAHKADLARRKGRAKLRQDIKRVRHYLTLEANIRRARYNEKPNKRTA